MTRIITIDPVTRIEGHARITLFLDANGKVADAQFHVTQFRGFEKFCEGRPLTEMPSLMARICGICPVSHLLASAKACDALLAVDIPPVARELRRLLNLAQFVQSHALSFFHLSSPDLLLGMDADPAVRNIIGLIQQHPDLARDGITLRKFGQEIIALLGGKRIHPAWVVPGGVNEPLTAQRRDRILADIPPALAIARKTIDWFKKSLDKYKTEIESFGNFPSLFLSIVGEAGELRTYQGNLRVIDEKGNILADQVEPANYASLIAEAVEPWSYLKFPYFKPRGYPDGLYRVGPLARINNAETCGTPLADAELTEFRQRFGRPAHSSFLYHYARLIEILFAIETMQQILQNPAILDKFVRARARPNRWEGIGITEAPRGTIIHHYRIDEHGQIIWANLIIATGHNNLAMNRSIRQVAHRFVNGNKLQEGMLNRVEAVIRCFDPCLSCSTHALGQMPLDITLVGPDGQVLDRLRR